MNESGNADGQVCLNAESGMAEAAETALRPLVRAGWHPGRDTGQQALLAALKTATVVPLSGSPQPWEVFPEAEQALREFYGLRILPWGPGRDVAASGCIVDPELALYTHQSMRGLAAELRTRLFPLGVTDTDGYLAVDEAGRLFRLDHGGRWFLGDSVAAGLCAVAEGHAPLRLRSHRWTQLFARIEDADILPDLVNTGMVAVHLLHHHGLFDVRAVEATAELVPGLSGAEALGVFNLRGGTLDECAEVLTSDLRGVLESNETQPDKVAMTLGLSPPEDASGPEATIRCTISAGGTESRRGILLTVSTGPGGYLPPIRDGVTALTGDLTAYAERRQAGTSDFEG